MRHINERGIEIIKGFEGFSSEPYLCPANVWTVGYGATRSSTGGPIDLDMEPITEAEAEALLLRDFENFRQSFTPKLFVLMLTTSKSLLAKQKINPNLKPNMGPQSKSEDVIGASQQTTC